MFFYRQSKVDTEIRVKFIICLKLCVVERGNKLTIGIIIKGPEGLVLAAESRITLEVHIGNNQVPVSFDNARKVLKFSEPNSFVGAVTYGLGGIGLRSAYSYIPEFESTLPVGQRLSIQDFAQKLSDFFMQQWIANFPPPATPTAPATPDNPTPPAAPTPRIPPMIFVVGGFNDGEPYGRVYQFAIPVAPAPIEQHPSNPSPVFGITWGGQREIVDRLITGYDARAIQFAKACLNLTQQQIAQLKQAFTPLQMQIPIQLLPLQDCIDLSLFFVRTTIEAQRLTVGIRGCGGNIDIAIITRQKGFEWVQQKKLHGEKENKNSVCE